MLDKWLNWTRKITKLVTHDENHATDVAESWTAKRQNGHWSTRWITSSVVFVFANLAVYLAERFEPTVPHFYLTQWVFGAVVNYFLRTVVFFPLAYATPTDLEKSSGLKITAGLNAAVELLHWIWGTQLFISDHVSPTTLVLGLSFMMLSVTAARYFSSHKLMAMSYAAVLWFALLWEMTKHDQVSFAMACVASLCAFLIYAIAAHPASSDNKDAKDQVAASQLQQLELESARIDAEQTLEKRSTVFAGVSHDFKQRLHALKLMTFSTIADMPRNDRNRNNLYRISAEVDDLDRFLGQVLEYVQMEASEIQAQIKSVSLQTIMQQADLHFEPVTLTKRIDLTFRPTHLKVKTDPVMLQRMLENLVSNALKFTRGRVLVAARSRKDFVDLEVWDQGPGIPPDALVKIFDAFHQETVLTDPESRGVGLGLAVVKRLADELKCEVSVKSNEGRGSVFRLRLPAAQF